MSQPCFFAPSEYSYFLLEATACRPREVLVEPEERVAKLFRENVSCVKQRPIQLPKITSLDNGEKTINTLLTLMKQLQALGELSQQNKDYAPFLQQGLERITAMQKHVLRGIEQLKVEKVMLAKQQHMQNELRAKEQQREDQLRDRMQTALLYSTMTCPGMRGLYYLPHAFHIAQQNELVHRSFTKACYLSQDMLMLTLAQERLEKELMLLQEAASYFCSVQELWITSKACLFNKDHEALSEKKLALKVMNEELEAYAAAEGVTKAYEAILVEAEGFCRSPGAFGICTSGKHIFDKVMHYMQEKKIDGGVLIIPNFLLNSSDLSYIDSKEKIFSKEFTILIGIEKAMLTIFADKKALLFLTEKQLFEEISHTGRAAERIHTQNTYFTPEGCVFAGIANAHRLSKNGLQVVWGGEKNSPKTAVHAAYLKA